MGGNRRPRRGSMGFYPRKRASSIVARIRKWPKVTEVKPLAFAGYKVGMLHIFINENNPNSPYFGKEILKPVTIIETPPLFVFGIRTYTYTPYGLKTLSEIWSQNLPKDLERVFTIPKKYNPEKNKKKIEKNTGIISNIRFVVATQPRKAGIHKKKPEVFEIEIGGDVKETYKYTLNFLGKEISIDDIFKSGECVDVISVSKGKGFEGVIKRFNVKILPRWHKHRKGHRKIGSIGPASPGTMSTIPRSGQLGFHQRTEYNKRILKIGEDPKEVNLKGGFKHYGLIRNKYVLLEGSVPGAIKRLVFLRRAIRPSKGLSIIAGKPISITYISSMSIGET